jgi:putative adenylate-forming enzyme
LLKELNLYSPDILAAPPSLLIDIASAQEKEYILIHPSQIISFAEVLHPLQKDYITKQIKAPLTEVYQCTEGFLGVSCSEGSIHLNEDFIQINKEWIDDDKFYPIITDFTRESQPIVNYKLNDVLQIKKDPCACGSPFISLEQIIGRDDDVLIFNNRKIYPDLLVRRIALHCNNFQNYTIIQTNENNLDIYIECTKKEMSQTEKYFREAISGLLFEFGIQNTELKFKNERVRIPGNKHRKIIRKICA